KQNINRRFSVPVTTETLYPIKIAKINVPNFQPIKTAFTAATSSLKHCFLTVECLQSESVRCVNRGTNTLKSLTEKMSLNEGEQNSPVLPRDSDRSSSVSSALQASHHIHHHRRYTTDEYEELLRYAVVTSSQPLSTTQLSKNLQHTTKRETPGRTLTGI
ncbi:hypothetical protein cypCar_00002808, partial [Cyprinus carpio]